MEYGGEERLEKVLLFNAGVHAHLEAGGVLGKFNGVRYGRFSQETAGGCVEQNGRAERRGGPLDYVL